MNKLSSPPNGNGYYHALTRRMILIFICVSFAPLFLVSGIILKQFHDAYHEKAADHLRELVAKHKQNIDRFLEEKLGNILLLSRMNTIARLQDETYLAAELERLQAVYNHVFTDLGIVTDQGLQTAYSGPFRLTNATYAKADWFKKAIRADHFISDVFLGLRGHPHFIIAVKKQDQGRNWLLRTTIDFKAFNSLVENLRVGKTGRAFILNRAGAFQTSASGDSAADNAIKNLHFQRETKPHQRIEVFQHKSRGHKKIFYATAFLKGGDWRLIFNQDADDAFADLNQSQNAAFTIIVLGGVLIVSMSIWLTRRMVDRIAAIDREKEMLNQQVIETGKLASIGELAAGIAHEINNPVAIMVEEAGWIEDLLEEEEFQDGKNLTEFHRALGQINTQGHRCKEITHKLLSFARKTDTRLKETDLNDLIREVVDLSTQRARYCNISFVTHLAKGLPVVSISPSEMQQVIFNLFNNAIDVMERDGGTITVSSQTGSRYVAIEIADDGPGIPRANLPKIFDPFFTTKPVGKGTGLGLSICYGIIRKMGGDISVKSVVEKGTTFALYIPINSEPGQAKQRGTVQHEAEKKDFETGT
jgi:two-component system, NtrC family, sensor kinase